jgi:hypothetical protein
MKTYREWIYSFTLDLGIILRWVVSFMPQLIYPQVLFLIGDWVGASSGPGAVEKRSCYPLRESNPGSPARPFTGLYRKPVPLMKTGCASFYLWEDSYRHQNTQHVPRTNTASASLISLASSGSRPGATACKDQSRNCPRRKEPAASLHSSQQHKSAKSRHTAWSLAVRFYTNRASNTSRLSQVV